MAVGTSIATLLDLFILPCILFMIYLVGLGVYRLYFSPIAAFPGPKLAALSNWYEFYHDVICQGQFTFKIQKLHKQYGKITICFFQLST